MSEVKSYTINGKQYQLQRLVLAQVKQFIEFMKVLPWAEIPADFNLMGLLGAIGDDLPRGLAIILVEKGTSPRDKDLEALTEDFRDSVDVDLATEIMLDFFEQNRVGSILERWAPVVKNRLKTIQEEMTLSKESPSSSPGEISANEKESSGAVH